MAQHPLNFIAPPPPLEPVATGKVKKRIQITTLEAWYKLLPTLPQREREVATALQLFITGPPPLQPTAYELYHFMLGREMKVYDVNSVRPVLTRLKDKGIVEFGDRKKCRITGESAYTWRFPEVLQKQMEFTNGPE